MTNNPIDKKDLAAALKSLREKASVSQQTLADHLRVPRSAISCIESGTRDMKFLEVVDAVTFILNQSEYETELKRLLWELDEKIEAGALELSKESMDFIFRRTRLT